MKRYVVKGLLLVVIFALAMIGYAAYAAWQWLHDPIGRPLVINVARGDSVRSVEATLETKGFIQWPRLWSFYVRFVQTGPLLIGEYAISPSESLLDLLSKMQEGDVVQHKITLVEGATIQQILRVLHQRETIQPTLVGVSASMLAAKLGLPYSSAEGWVYPETYHYTRNTTDLELLKRAVKAMKSVLDDEWGKRKDALPYDNPYQTLIMASIVERETGVRSERAMIAGVFVKRLRVGMRLQTDPTVIYGMGERYNGNITKKDLNIDTPYNTYTRSGLTPTPIANPGRAAIHAALHPEESGALYFVAKGDGSHYFSDTLAEHNSAVKRYQIKRREAYRSTPEPLPQ